jgi:hypothetical protein
MANELRNYLHRSMPTHLKRAFSVNTRVTAFSNMKDVSVGTFYKNRAFVPSTDGTEEHSGQNLFTCWRSAAEIKRKKNPHAPI